MKRLLFAIVLVACAIAASAQPVETGGLAKISAGQDIAVAALQPHPPGTRSFNDALADTHAPKSRTDSRVAPGAKAAGPEQQSYALLLAGLCAIVFIAVRRRHF